MLILIKVRTKEKSSLNCEHQVLPWEKKVCRVGDLILLYWYNYIDLKVIKSSDIPVISGVVYDLGFCPKHVWIMWGRWGTPPHCRQGGHSPTLGSPSLTLCTFAGHSGCIWTHKQDRQHSWSRTQGQPWVTPSSGVHNPGGIPSQAFLPRKVHERNDTQSPACHEHLHGQPQSSQQFCHHTSPARPWLGCPNPLCPAWTLLPCSATGPGGCPPLAMGPGLGWGCTARDPLDLTFPTFNVCTLSMAPCVPANAFIPLLWHKPCFYTEGNTASWFCTLTFSNSDSNARQNF